MRFNTISSPKKPFRLGAHNEIYRIKLVEKAGMRRHGFHNGHLAVGANNKHPDDRRNESSKYVHAYKPSDLGLDATATWIFEFCGDENNPYDYCIKLYDPLDTSSVLGGYLTQSALDGQDKRDDGSAYVHLYYPTSQDPIARWLMIPMEDGNFQIVFKNERGTIRNPDQSRKLVLCLHNYWGKLYSSPFPGGRVDPRDDHSAYAHVRIEDENMECSTWSLEVTNWNAILSAHHLFNASTSCPLLLQSRSYDVVTKRSSILITSICPTYSHCVLCFDDRLTETHGIRHTSPYQY